MQKERINMVLYAILIILIIVFSTLFFTNLLINKQNKEIYKNISDIYEKSTEIKIELNFYDLIEKEADCNKMSNDLKHISDLIYNLENKTALYQKNINDEEYFSKIEYDYSLNLIDFWIKLKKFNNRCPLYKENIILYFYKKNCIECLKYDSILSNINKKENAFIFSLPIDSNIGIIDNLLKYYKIDKNKSSIVVNDKVIKNINYENIKKHLN